MGVIGVQSMQKQAVDSGECSLVDWRQSTRQHDVDNMMTHIIGIPPLHLICILVYVKDMNEHMFLMSRQPASA